MIEYQGDSKEAADIIDCVGTIISTPYGTMPYMRDMGISSDIIGSSTPAAQEQLFNEVVEQVDDWEDRATVSEVTFETDGKHTIPKVVIADAE